MPRPRILDQDKSYTFRSYFEMSHEPEDILAEFGYSFTQASLSLPSSGSPLALVPELRQRIERTLPIVTLTSEMARREALVAPILIEVAAFCQCQLRIEYSLAVSQWLKGSLDYLLRSTQNLLVVEAKHDDLSRGFTQMAVELIALAEWDESQDVLYGAVTIGEVWRFGKLERSTKQITQDLSLFRVPADIEELVAVIVGIMER